MKSGSVAKRLLVALGCLGAECSRSSAAVADSHRTSALSWVELPGAEGCGGAPAIAKAVEDRLGRHAIVSPAEADLSIEARADRSGHPLLWHAVVVLRRADGEILGIRELGSAADDCSELRSAVALATALMIDPDAALAARDSAAPESPLAPPPPAPPAAPPATQIIYQRVEVPVPVVTPSPPGGWLVEPSAAFALGFGLLPSIAAGVRVGVSVAPPRVWAFEASGGAWGNQTAPAAQGALVRFSMADAGLAVCPLRLGERGRPSLSACAGAEVAFLQSESQGFVAPRSSLDPALNLVALGHLSLPVAAGISVRAGGGIGLAVLRDRFVYEDAMKATQIVSAAPLVTAECDMGLSVSLP